MAGWKLRKDKTQEVTPDAAPEVSTPAAHSTSVEEASPVFETDPVFETISAEEPSLAAESSDWLSSGWHAPTEPEPAAGDLTTVEPFHGSTDAPAETVTLDGLLPLEHSTEIPPHPLAPPPDFETDHDLHFEPDLHFEDEEPPLTLVDFTEPITPETTVPASVFAMPRLEPSAYGSASEAGEHNFSHTLRMNREELAAAYPSSLLSDDAPSDIPTVAPFILDTPTIPPTDEPIHRLIVQIGRLSAPFDITKDVTIIGRPDSALHYYPDVEIDIDDAVSRRHAEVLRRDDGCYLTDVGSTNGTLLNGERLAPMEERLLVHGDRIRIGELTEIIFE